MNSKTTLLHLLLHLSDALVSPLILGAREDLRTVSIRGKGCRVNAGRLLAIGQMLTDQVVLSSLLVDIIQRLWLHFAIFILFFFLLTQHNMRLLCLIIVIDKHMLLLL